MADRPPQLLRFDPRRCPDCAVRSVQLSPAMVEVPDDFDWSARDFEGFRRVMLEDLSRDNPDRTRWTEADGELAIIEVLAAGLDRMSHAIDTIFAERFLATANWPRSVVRLLTMIDGVSSALSVLRPVLTPYDISRFGFDDAAMSDADTLLAVLTAYPQLNDLAKAAGLADVTRIESLVALQDVERFLASVPAFSQVSVKWRRTGQILTYDVAILCEDSDILLHDRILELGVDAAEDMVLWFKTQRARLSPPAALGYSTGSVLDLLQDADIRRLTIRTAVLYLANPLLPMNTRMRLSDGRRAGILLQLCVEVAPNYFRSEIDMAVRAVLTAQEGGFFDQRNFGFGTPLYLSDLQAALMAVEGVRGVIVSRLQIAADPASDATTSGVLMPPPDQALCLDTDHPGIETGLMSLTLIGGMIG